MMMNKQNNYFKLHEAVRLIDMGRLNPTERAFIEESVQSRIIEGVPLTDRQKNWLRQLERRYPANRRVIVAPAVEQYEWV